MNDMRILGSHGRLDLQLMQTERARVTSWRKLSNVNPEENFCEEVQQRDGMKTGSRVEMGRKVPLVSRERID